MLTQVKLFTVCMNHNLEDFRRSLELTFDVIDSEFRGRGEEELS